MLRDDPAVLAFVLPGLQGVADTIVNNWASHLDPAEFTQFSAAALTRAITLAEPAG
ncbi:Transcriptional regulator, TetR family (fragment) [Rhodococcus sp. RD6.2]|uniref:hypothetical protein n=1 Tax=Rhodococcus sp. RD6.2 TaxID=260936 RepID=UPI00063BACA6